MVFYKKHIIFFALFIFLFSSNIGSVQAIYKSNLGMLPKIYTNTYIDSTLVPSYPKEDVFEESNIYKKIKKMIEIVDELENEEKKLNTTIEEKESELKKKEKQLKELEKDIKTKEVKVKELNSQIEKKEEELTPFLRPTDGRISSDYGGRVHPIYGKQSFHNGIDIAKKGNVEIKSIADGVVSKSYRSQTLGEVIFIKHNYKGQTYEAVYAHMRGGSREFSVGQSVKKGQKIGMMGSTGDSTGQHLHFELHKGYWTFERTNVIDPKELINF